VQTLSSLCRLHPQQINLIVDNCNFQLKPTQLQVQDSYDWIENEVLNFVINRCAMIRWSLINLFAAKENPALEAQITVNHSFLLVAVFWPGGNGIAPTCTLRKLLSFCSTLLYLLTCWCDIKVYWFFSSCCGKM